MPQSVALAAGNEDDHACLSLGSLVVCTLCASARLSARSALCRRRCVGCPAARTSRREVAADVCLRLLVALGRGGAADIIGALSQHAPDGSATRAAGMASRVRRLLAGSLAGATAGATAGAHAGAGEEAADVLPSGSVIARDDLARQRVAEHLSQKNSLHSLVKNPRPLPTRMPTT